MRGGQTIEVARRWRALAEPDPRLLNLDNLKRWHKLAITASLESFQQGMG